MDLNLYQFRTRWEIGAPPADIYAALEAVEQYPEWWPEVRAVEHLDEDRYRMRVRSLLPYDLNFVGIQSDRDPQAGVLSMRLEGDLHGFSRWTITPLVGRTTVTFDEEVVAATVAACLMVAIPSLSCVCHIRCVSSFPI